MHQLSAEHSITQMSAENQPALRIRSGDIVRIETKDCFAGCFDQEVAPRNALRSNPATGPIFIEGAHPGDTLRLQILNVELGSTGIVESTMREGCLGRCVEFTEHYPVALRDAMAIYSDGLRIPLKPMIGVLGVAPARGSVSTLIPGSHGASMDCSRIRQNSVVYLPVFTEGGLLALGGLHGVMGDGVLGGSGLEVSGSVTLMAEVLRGFYLMSPCVVFEEQISFLASAATVDVAALQASELLCAFLVRHAGYAKADAVRMMTLAANAAICQAVREQKTVMLSLPVSYLSAYGWKLP